MIKYAYPVGNIGLSSEYELPEAKPLRQMDVSDFIGDTALERFLSPHMSHVEEEFVDVLGGQYA